MKVANEFKSKVMNYAIASKQDYSNDFESLGLSSEGDDPVVSIKSDDGSKYAMKEKFRYHFIASDAFLNFLLLNKKNCLPPCSGLGARFLKAPEIFQAGKAIL